MNQNPRVRALEPIPVEVEAQQLVVLRDPLHFISEALTVPVPVYLLLTLMDGSRNVFDLQSDFREQFGGRISATELENLLVDLDEHYILDSERFALLRDRVIGEFVRTPARPAAHAGSAYEADADALGKQLDAFF